MVVVGCGRVCGSGGTRGGDVRDGGSVGGGKAVGHDRGYVCSGRYNGGGCGLRGGRVGFFGGARCTPDGGRGGRGVVCLRSNARGSVHACLYVWMHVCVNMYVRMFVLRLACMCAK